jgi:hypothetical protein
MRYAALICCLLATGIATADEVTMKNGQKVDGHVQGLKDGHLEIGVYTGQVFGGFPAMATNKLKFSNVRSIKFDGRDDYFSIVKKNEDLTFGYVRDLSKGKFTVDGQEPIAASSVKALVPSKPDEKESK